MHMRVDHVDRGLAIGRTGRLAEGGLDDEAMAVLGQAVAFERFVSRKSTSSLRLFLASAAAFATVGIASVFEAVSEGVAVSVVITSSATRSPDNINIDRAGGAGRGPNSTKLEDVIRHGQASTGEPQLTRLSNGQRRSAMTQATCYRIVVGWAWMTSRLALRCRTSRHLTGDA